MESSGFSGKTIASNLWWKLLERVFSQGINLVVQIVLARILLPEDFGCLAIIVAITNYAAIFVQSGLSTVLIQKKNLEEKDISTMLTASLGIAFVLYLTLYFLSPVISKLYELPEILWPLRVLSFVLFLNAIFSVQTAILSRNMRFKAVFVRTAFAVPISGAIGISMACLGYGVWALVAHNLVHMAVMVIVTLFGTDVNLRLGFTKTRAKEMYAFSSKIMMSSLVSGFGDTIRTMTIGKRYSTDNLAYYDKAYVYPQYLVSIIHLSIQSVMLSVMSRQQDDKRALCETNRKTVSMVSFVMFPLLIGSIMAARPFILVLLTEKWEPCIVFFMLFCFFRLLGCITSTDKQAFFALGRSDIAMWFEIGLLLLNLSVLFFTVNFSIWAIAIGATVVEFLGCLVLCIISSRLYGYSLKDRFQDFKLPLYNSLVMALLLYLVSFIPVNNLLMLFLQIIIGLTSYYILAKTTGDTNLILFLNVIKNNTNKN